MYEMSPVLQNNKPIQHVNAGIEQVWNLTYIRPTHNSRR